MSDTFCVQLWNKARKCYSIYFPSMNIEISEEEKKSNLYKPQNNFKEDCDKFNTILPRDEHRLVFFTQSASCRPIKQTPRTTTDFKDTRLWQVTLCIRKRRLGVFLPAENQESSLLWGYVLLIHGLSRPCEAACQTFKTAGLPSSALCCMRARNHRGYKAVWLHLQTAQHTLHQLSGSCLHCRIPQWSILYLDFKQNVKMCRRHLNLKLN